ncbi:TlpA family protein disulfide reductase [Sphingomonas abietis]|uniref:TlpA disulfide reductase family protein n=1 Tax=Sphingomonas abietis TaxID=3012344 RepID=A0ABY7NS33_9SPHN|nr:TlpA disulfide reductase family protein [Sphingomonas abietis]WBO23610.1 TlpA disulfide reductase family protein [Sphingomonas abietis]
MAVRKVSGFTVAAVLLSTMIGASAANALHPGQAAPAYMVTMFDKQKITSDQLRGQVVMINLWATWCGPCKRELPAIDAYYRQHAKDGLRVFAVATEDSVPDYMLKPLSAMLAFPLAHRVSGSAFQTLGGVPTSYIIDRAGVVRYAKADAFDQQTLDAVVGPLLAEPAPAVTAAR